MNIIRRRKFFKASFFGALGFMFAASCKSKKTGTHATGNNYQYKRDIIRDKPYDLVICGGGMAGATAAIAAGRLGAKVLLLESMGNLGGMATSGLVTAFDGMGDGEQMIVGGIMREIVETMYQKGYMPDWQQPDTWRKNLLHPTRIKPDPLKRLLENMVLDAGVEIRYFSKLIDADADPEQKNVNGVIVGQVDGMHYIPAATFIDGTGDALLCDFAGIPYDQAGRDTEKIMPPTLCSMWSGMEWGETENAKKYFDQAIADGHFSKPDVVKYSHFIMSYIGKSLGGLNGGHVFNTDPVDPASLTNAMVEGRKLNAEYESFLRKYVPGYENVELAATAMRLGVRESRRIRGEYRLDFDDFKARKHFPDQIGVFNKEVDIHVYEPTQKELERKKEQSEKTGRLGKGESYGIPYGVLVPKDWKNVWAAGRCVSTDVMVHGSTRVMPSSSMMGQAAGTAAVQVLDNNEQANTLNTARLVKTLRNNDAFLPQKKLSEEMTRG